MFENKIHIKIQQSISYQNQSKALYIINDESRSLRSNMMTLLIIILQNEGNYQWMKR